MKLFPLQIIFVAQPIKFCPCNVLPQLRVQICADYLRMRCDHGHPHGQVSVKLLKVKAITGFMMLTLEVMPSHLNFHNKMALTFASLKWLTFYFLTGGKAPSPVGKIVFSLFLL